MFKNIVAAFLDDEWRIKKKIISDSYNILWIVKLELWTQMIHSQYILTNPDFIYLFVNY